MSKIFSKPCYLRESFNHGDGEYKRDTSRYDPVTAEQKLVIYDTYHTVYDDCNTRSVYCSFIMVYLLYAADCRMFWLVSSR